MAEFASDSVEASSPGGSQPAAAGTPPVKRPSSLFIDSTASISPDGAGNVAASPLSLRLPPPPRSAHSPLMSPLSGGGANPSARNSVIFVQPAFGCAEAAADPDQPPPERPRRLEHIRLLPPKPAATKALSEELAAAQARAARQAAEAAAAASAAASSSPSGGSFFKSLSLKRSASTRAAPSKGFYANRDAFGASFVDEAGARVGGDGGAGPGATLGAATSSTSISSTGSGGASDLAARSHLLARLADLGISPQLLRSPLLDGRRTDESVVDLLAGRQHFMYNYFGSELTGFSVLPDSLTEAGGGAAGAEASDSASATGSLSTSASMVLEDNRAPTSSAGAAAYFVGFTGLVDALRASRKETRDVVSYLRTRAQYEDEYHRNLHRVTASAYNAKGFRLPEPPAGGRAEPGKRGAQLAAPASLEDLASVGGESELAGIWSQVLRSTTLIADQHRQLTLTLMQNLSNQLEVFDKEMRREVENEFMHLESLHNDYAQNLDDTNKLKKQYFALSKDLFNARKELSNPKEPLNPRATKSLRNKIAKLNDEAFHVNNQYQAAIGRTNQSMLSWVSIQKAACSRLQCLETVRNILLRNAILELIEAQEELIRQTQPSLEAVRRNIHASTSMADIEGFLSRTRTGDSIPAYVEYEDFYAVNLEAARLRDLEEKSRNPEDANRVPAARVTDSVFGLPLDACLQRYNDHNVAVAQAAVAAPAPAAAPASAVSALSPASSVSSISSASSSGGGNATLPEDPVLLSQQQAQAASLARAVAAARAAAQHAEEEAGMAPAAPADGEPPAPEPAAVPVEIPPPPASRLFAKPLLAPGKPFKWHVPEVVVDCVYFLEKFGLREEGIYRVPGRKNRIEDLQNACRTSQPPLADHLLANYPAADVQISDVASLLKLFLRSAPQAVIPHELLQPFIDLCSLTDLSQRNAELERLVLGLPDANRDTLVFLLHHLWRVLLFTNHNLMNAQALSICWAPCIFGDSHLDLQFVQLQPSLLAYMIESCPQVFPVAPQPWDVAACVYTSPVEQLAREQYMERSADQQRSTAEREKSSIAREIAAAIHTAHQVKASPSSSAAGSPAMHEHQHPGHAGAAEDDAAGDASSPPPLQAFAAPPPPLQPLQPEEPDTPPVEDDGLTQEERDAAAALEAAHAAMADLCTFTSEPPTPISPGSAHVPSSPFSPPPLVPVFPVSPAGSVVSPPAAAAAAAAAAPPAADNGLGFDVIDSSTIDYEPYQPPAAEAAPDYSAFMNNAPALGDFGATFGVPVVDTAALELDLDALLSETAAAVSAANSPTTPF
ncbi:hypothetical protein H696_06020 [Fonticula alba]|uniref:Rho-GAP domain-containing protein n=1 Tax=Fonticula alba TaxID=691883 RepID=A0A058YZV7_FONAL|nr:hypothetical protein H696_06020 [Fonticula alba]KCV67500.1 hypothetical protein H696_06020 [Fonticula alba]|eukprot:XP_009498061.1 hypothetical protein H696_06020 [Fonticula alba]